MGTVLQTKDLTRTFGYFTAVDGVNFVVEEGEIRGLIGPNGAGKTTFFDLITHRLEPTRGRVLFRGKDITKNRIHSVARNIARKFQTPSVYDDLSILQNIEIGVQRKEYSPFSSFSSKGRPQVHDKALDILREMGLDDLRDKPASSLSHGQRQWLEIGITLATNPELLLLDEPTAGMSIGETTRTGALIKDIARRRNLTVIFVEHDMEFVKDVAQKTSVMHKGKIIGEGALEELRKDKFVSEAYLGGSSLGSGSYEH